MKRHAVADQSSDSHDERRETLDSDLHALKEAAHPHLQAVAARSQEAIRQFRQHYRQTQRQSQERVRQHPLKSVAVAVGLGVLLGALFTRLNSGRSSAGPQ